jgi:hypothetical protein
MAAPVDPGLDDLLGPEAAAEVRAELVAIARRWVAEVAPGRAFEATSPTAAADAALVHGCDGPLLLVAPDVPWLDVALAEAALADLADGAPAAVAPSNDGTPYLIALEGPSHELVELVADGFEAIMARAGETGRAVGMLRNHRRLVTPADARALAADPTAPPALLRHLAAARRR